jgi:hypothetical protein
VHRKQLRTQGQKTMWPPAAAIRAVRLSNSFRAVRRPAPVVWQGLLQRVPVPARSVVLRSRGHCAFCSCFCSRTFCST